LDDSQLARHKRFTAAAHVVVYFRDSRSPWQPGGNENTNGVLGQYLRSGSDLSVHGEENLDAIALQLNTRPRKTLGYKHRALRLLKLLHGRVEPTSSIFWWPLPEP
jgi:IS30 family transposase